MPERDVDGPRKVVEVREYAGESSILLAATQLGSAYSETRKRHIVDEWVDFFGSGPTPIRSLHFLTRTPKRLFAALSEQAQLSALQVKWGDYDNLHALSKMTELVTLRLRGASGVQDLRPLAGLTAVEALQVEGLRGLVDASPIGQMHSVTDLEIGGNWTTPKIVHITSAGFLTQMPQLRRLILHTLVVDDRDYLPLMTLPNLQKVRVMATRGMNPPIEELIKRLPWEHDESTAHAAIRCPRTGWQRRRSSGLITDDDELEVKRVSACAISSLVDALSVFVGPTLSWSARVVARPFVRGFW